MTVSLLPSVALVQNDLSVRKLGSGKVLSPLGLSFVDGDDVANYVADGVFVRLLTEFEQCDDGEHHSLGFEKAGPREYVYFDPAKTRAGVVTCGGLCPGINNVIRSLVLELHHKYGVPEVVGFRYGFAGLNPAHGHEPIRLDLDAVRDIHRVGGSLLGMSRGGEDPSIMVQTLVDRGINMLFCVGGDGTQRGAHAICQEIDRRGLDIAVVGIPKTIDNDVGYVEKTFGFDTAVETARIAIDAAHTEAVGALNGVGLVKLMGRDSGFIAAAAALASLDVNFVLVPEVRWELEGECGLLSALEHRLEERKHAVIVVAEGCGARLTRASSERDASGNVRYAADDMDIGLFLRDQIKAHFKAREIPLTLKYIDPSYMIRGVPANAADSIFCDRLARHAVHAAMAGRTDLVIGRWHGIFTHVPIALATSHRKKINPDGSLWLAVSETTGQPILHA